MDNKKWLEYDNKNCIELIFKMYMSLIKLLENLTVPILQKYICRFVII